MSPINQFFLLASHVLGSLRAASPITLVLSVLIIVAATHAFIFKRSQFHKLHLLMFSPLALSFLILVWGTVMAPEGNTRGPSWASQVVGVLWLLHIPLAMAVIYFTRGLRLLAAAVALFELWIGSLSALITVLSIGNVWF